VRFSGLLLLLSLWGCASGARADLPSYRAYPAKGDRLVLWVASERGLARPEIRAAQRLAAQGIEVWAIDLLEAYFLPQLASGMDEVPQQDMADWLRAAQGGGKRVAVVGIGRAAVPLLRAVARLGSAQRGKLCVLLIHPNLYTVAEPLLEPEFLNVGDLSDLRVRVLQPRRSAATPWLPGLLDSLALQGVTVTSAILENVREGYWVRESPTPFEVAEGRRMDALVLHELNAEGCRQ
jgi:hypothetical protein